MPIDGLPLMLESEKKAEPWLSHLSVSGEYPIIHHAADFVKTLGSLFFMMADQASGLPTAEHGLFHRCFSFFLFLFSLFFVPKSNSLNALSSCRFKIDALTVKGVVSSKKGLSVNSFGRLGSNSSFLFTNKQANNNGCSPFVFCHRPLQEISRSLNNILEHFHQSFFFYLLPNSLRYVSIGLYMPPFLAIIAGLLLTAIRLWWQAGQPPAEDNQALQIDGVPHAKEGGVRSRRIGPAASALALSFFGGFLIYQTPLVIKLLMTTVSANDVRSSLESNRLSFSL